MGQQIFLGIKLVNNLMLTDSSLESSQNVIVRGEVEDWARSMWATGLSAETSFHEPYVSTQKSKQRPAPSLTVNFSIQLCSG